MNSKAKGNRGEKEFTALCREEGYDTHRAQQPYARGGIDTADIVGLPHLHVEVKRTEKLRLYEAMAQATRDSAGQAIPIVAHRRNRDGWLITMRAGDWFSLYREWETGHF